MTKPSPELPRLPDGPVPQPIRDFFDYWNGLPKHGLIPRLEDYLTRPPPHLQPFVGIADVASPSDMRIRLFGTGLAGLTGDDPTGHDMAPLYAPAVQPVMQRLVWLLVSRPAGYLCVRSVLTTTGRTVHNPSICLPLDVPTSGLRAVISFAYQDPAAFSYGSGERQSLIQDLKLTDWIDLGAGVPENS